MEIQHQVNERLGVLLEGIELRPAAVHRAAVAPRPAVRREHDTPADTAGRSRTTTRRPRRAMPRPARDRPDRRAERLPHSHRALHLRRQPGRRRGGHAVAAVAGAAPRRGRPARRDLLRRRVVGPRVPARELVLLGVRLAVLDPAVGALAQDLPVRPGARAERPVQRVEPVGGEQAAGNRGPWARAAAHARGIGAAVGDVEVAGGAAVCLGRGLEGVAGRRVLCRWALGCR